MYERWQGPVCSGSTVCLLHCRTSPQSPRLPPRSSFPVYSYLRQQVSRVRNLPPPWVESVSSESSPRPRRLHPPPHTARPPSSIRPCTGTGPPMSHPDPQSVHHEESGRDEGTQSYFWVEERNRRRCSPNRSCFRQPSRTGCPRGGGDVPIFFHFCFPCTRRDTESPMSSQRGGTRSGGADWRMRVVVEQ